VSFHLVVLADQDAASRLRGAFGAWLTDQLRWPAEQTHELTRAVGEAVANVVEHAYPSGEAGSASINAGLVTSPGNHRKQVIVVVTDYGLWRAAHTRVHHPRGLRTMRACTDSLHIQRTFSGTKITMASRPVLIKIAPNVRPTT
jgi:serine/threonine-protein kinase RsbW